LGWGRLRADGEITVTRSIFARFASRGSLLRPIATLENDYFRRKALRVAQPPDGMRIACSTLPL
jgi:hypothetical protein